MKLDIGPRFVGIVWLPGGPGAVRIYNLYGDAAGDQKALDETTEITRACAWDSEVHGQCPAILAGDFNQTLDSPISLSDTHLLLRV